MLPRAFDSVAVSLRASSNSVSVSCDTWPSPSKRRNWSWFRVVVDNILDGPHGHLENSALLGQELHLVRPLAGDDMVDEERGNDQENSGDDPAHLAGLDAGNGDAGQFEDVDVGEHGGHQHPWGKDKRGGRVRNTSKQVSHRRLSGSDHEDGHGAHGQGQHTANTARDDHPDARAVAAPRGDRS
jgi:hypothetical protein